jgi:phosphatidylglycerophosphatase A
MHTPRLLFSTTLGLGRLRPAPGTWGSLPPPAIAYLLVLAGFGPTSTLYWLVIGLVFIAFCIGCILEGDLAEAVLGKKDHGSVVADETAGQCIPLLALAWAPASVVTGWWPAMLTMGGSFLAFRLTDIIKPPPAMQIQKLPSGWGVLLDDLVAGIYAAILVLVVTHLVA